MKNYSFNDLKKGDIYEHFGGGIWMVVFVNRHLKCYQSMRVNDSEIQTHRVGDVKQVWFCDSQ